jgi:Concanavalin A-like lectin/glucanases superfamily
MFSPGTRMAPTHLFVGTLVCAGLACVRLDAPSDPLITPERDAATDATVRRDMTSAPPVDLGGLDVASDAAAAPDLPAAEVPVDVPIAETAPEAAPPEDAGDMLARGLVARWPFDEGMGASAADATGNGNAGQMFNNPRWLKSTVPGAGATDFAVRFDGIDPSMQVAAQTIPALEAPKSIAYWFSAERASAAANGRQTTCVALIDAGMRMGLHVGTDRGRPAVWQKGANAGMLMASGPPPAAGFHHIGYTFDGTVHRLYVDGRVVGMGMQPAQTGRVATLLVGTYAVPNEMCTGQIDDLRVYNRALSESELGRLAMP